MHRKYVKAPSRSEINFALKHLWAKIEELEAKLAEAGPSEAEPSGEFDWENSEDEEALIEYLATLGEEADARATPNSLKRKIKEKLEQTGE